MIWLIIYYLIGVLLLLIGLYFETGEIKVSDLIAFLFAGFFWPIIFLHIICDNYGDKVLIERKKK